MVMFAWACEGLGSVIWGLPYRPPNATYCPFRSLPGRSCSQKLPASPAKALASPGNTETLGEAPVPTSSPLFSMPLLHPSSSFRPTQRSLSPGLSQPTPASSSAEPYHLTHHLSWLLSSPSAFYLTTPRATKALTEPPHPPPPLPNSQPYTGLWN